MRRFVLAILASASFLMALTPLDLLYHSTNPVSAAFRRDIVSLEVVYDTSQSTLTRLVGSLGISSDFLNVYVSPALYYPMGLVEEMGNSKDILNEISAFVPLSIALKIGNSIVVSGALRAMYTGGNFYIYDSPTVSFGLGGMSNRYRRMSSGALYYMTNDLVILGESGLKVNDSFNFKKGAVGVYSYSKTLNSEAYFNLSLDLSVVDELSSGEYEGSEALQAILNDLTGDLIVSSGNGIFGGGWNRGEYYALFGLSFNFLKVWVETSGGKEKEFFRDFLIKGRISF